MLTLVPKFPAPRQRPRDPGVVASVDNIPPTFAHELIHYQQHAEGKSLLAQAVYQYGMKHEAELWDDFRKEVNGADASHWLCQTKPRMDVPPISAISWVNASRRRITKRRKASRKRSATS